MGRRGECCKKRLWPNFGMPEKAARAAGERGGVGFPPPLILVVAPKEEKEEEEEEEGCLQPRSWGWEVWCERGAQRGRAVGRQQTFLRWFWNRGVRSVEAAALFGVNKSLICSPCFSVMVTISEYEISGLPWPCIIHQSV